MPLMSDTPVILSQVNRWEITYMAITVANAPRCDIHLKRSYVAYNADLEADVTTEVDTKVVTIAGAEFAAEFLALTTGDTLYAEVKARAYGVLRARGLVPEAAAEAPS